MITSLIVAAAQNRIIGSNHKLPWHLPTDLKYFRDTTRGHTVIMGRKTLDSIGHLLPNRRNIVVSRNPDEQQLHLKMGAETASSIEEALVKASLTADGEPQEVFVIGGAQVYQAALPYADRILLTDVMAEPEGDTCFPVLPSADWYLAKEGEWQQGQDDEYRFRFLVFEKVGNKE